MNKFESEDTETADRLTDGLVLVGGHLEFVSLFPDQLKVTDSWGEAAPAVIGPDNMCARV